MTLKRYLSEAEIAAVQPVTGDEFDISVRDITNIETVVVEHAEGSITIALDDAAIKMLEECGCTFEEEDEQIDEFLPLLALGAEAGELGAVALGAEAGSLGSAAGRALGGTAAKAAGNKLSNMFAKKDSDSNNSGLSGIGKQLALADQHTDESMPNEGDIVKINYDTEHKGQLGQVVELAPSGKLAWVEFKDGSIESYDMSDLEKVTDDEAEAHLDQEAYDESMNDVRRLAGMPANENRFEEPMTGWRIVSKKDDSVVKGQTFASKEEAQKYLMTKMFANHQDYKVAQFESKVNEDAEQRKQNRLWLQIDDYEKRARATKNDIKKHHYNRMAQELRDKLKTNDEPVSEAEYQGRNVPLGKPMQGDVKKFKVYVKDPKTGNVKKVNFGDPNMRIKKSNPARRKSFRARHHCDNPGPRTKARYWSCRKW